MRAWVRWVTLHQRTLPVGSSSFAVEILYHLEIIDKSSHTQNKTKNKISTKFTRFYLFTRRWRHEIFPPTKFVLFFLHFPFVIIYNFLFYLSHLHIVDDCVCVISFFHYVLGSKEKKKTQVSHSFFFSRLIRRIDRTTAVHCRFVTEFHSPLHCNAIPSPYSSSYTNVTQCRRRCRRRRVLYSRVVCQIAVLTSVSWIRTRRI